MDRFLPQTPSHTDEVYLDAAAATPLSSNAHAAMEAAQLVWANPSSIHEAGRRARALVEDARTRIAHIAHCQPSEVIFTSGGTESCNLAIRGVAHAARNAGKGSHLICSAIEHHAVLESFRALEQEGFSLTVVSPDSQGRVDAHTIKNAMRSDTVLVSVMHANNETGAIQPLRAIGRICKERGIPFHTDACASSSFVPIDIDSLHVDLLSFSGSKLYGPKGIGALVCRHSIPLKPLLSGGGQERGLRAGTLPTSLIVGLAAALEESLQLQEAEWRRLSTLRMWFVQQLHSLFPESLIHGPEQTEQVLRSIVNVSFPGVSGEAVVLYLSASRVFAATGAACTSEKTEPSHVLTSMGVSEEVARGSVRFSFSRTTTQEDLSYLLSLLPGILRTLRSSTSTDSN